MTHPGSARGSVCPECGIGTAVFRAANHVTWLCAACKDRELRACQAAEADRQDDERTEESR